ncbi:thioredoxin-disulfide reductase [Anaerococcus hydrogenalis]|uniref:Thioredoxin reductase n=1 Tax=Anaerococcus hydrogenalis TaxID=33029 RepID=A0A2N6ULF7_9FIRM|nr:thioredoxin-disulfide reductase [Anaerococcus hydrogenalis]MDU4018928.1 thioredoxin-disulfide reductase [Finegoldia magna]MDK7694613.1 thioredoxin-disulfide reductase [Anaerococcus hydrogenalis]MDK7696391.1 thioredoxin-disulfide reductase [Anaerococcus hydrogenalis]MDK7707640.1 thioredoxin-disulfide reductase [Anaerococcus hydrogenalis]PMC82651.1 thioredoxin-disulfide reductase [Anaerococcus hydrogenalis]
MLDVIIIGAGPAGLTAGLYAGRAKLKTLILEKDISGGQIATTEHVENYPGSMKGAGGLALSERMEEQAKQFCDIKYKEVTKVDLTGDIKKVYTKDEVYEAKVVILSTGASHRKLNVKGEKEFANLGVSYCSTCDGPFYQGLDIYVVGGGEAALEEALYLTKFGKSVNIIHRREGLRASQTVIDRCKENEKINFLLNYTVNEIKGDTEVKELILKNTQNGELKSIKNDDNSPIGVFIYIGNIPQTDLFKDQVKLENGYIPTDEDMKTNVKGVFAVGDTRVKKIRQMVTATSDGCIASEMANKYIENGEW